MENLKTPQNLLEITIDDGSESDATILFEDCMSDDMSETSESHVDFMLDESFLYDDENLKVLEISSENINSLSEKNDKSNLNNRRIPISREDKEISETSESELSSDESESSEDNADASEIDKETLISRFLKQNKKNLEKNLDIRSKRNHKSKHPDTKKVKFQCKKCPKTYFHHQSLRRHAYEDHGEVISPLQVNLPNLSQFFSPQRRLACHLCDMRFKHLQSIRYHVNNHSNFAYQCHFPNCRMKYSKEIILREHQRRSGHEGDFVCDKCGITTEKYTLGCECVREEWRLANDIPVQCSQCDKTLSNRHSLNQHLTRHLTFKYKCKHCQMMFGTQRYMHLHQQSAHNMIFKNLFPDKKRSPRKSAFKQKFQPIEYKCLRCDLTFAKNLELWDHLRAHHF